MGADRVGIELAMKLVVFGLSITSSWGNGHATLWRGLFRAMAKRGHRPVFFERDTDYYRAHRDLTEMEGARICVYRSWEEVKQLAAQELADADLGMVTSYCADAAPASDMVLNSRAPWHCFYDLDTPVTLAALDQGETVSYLPAGGLGGFDLVLSYTGGQALEQLRTRLGAKRVAPLYGSVDPEIHRPVSRAREFDLSYMGTFAKDRQDALRDLFLEPALKLPDYKFLLGGAQYGADFPWGANVYFRQHLPPADHAGFYCSSNLTLNVTRQAMKQMGYCPSGRLFEAAACGVPILTDLWEGLDQFFVPGQEILTAATMGEAMAAITSNESKLRAIAKAARERTLAEHTAECRVVELERALSAKAGAA